MQAASEHDRDLVLVGGGHSHLSVIRQLAMVPIAGLRVTVVSKDIHTPYSGMLPGLIAGHYSEDQCHIDLRRLCQWAGFRLYHSSAVRIDSRQQTVHCDNRPPLRYDWLSINTGSTPDLSRIAGAREYGAPVKPIAAFLAALEHWQASLPSRPTPAWLTVVGGGAAGVELALAIQYRMHRQGPPGKVRYRLVSADKRLLPSHNHRVAGYFTHLLEERGIELNLEQRVDKLDEHTLYSTTGAELKSDFTVLATHAAAPAWLRDSDIAVDQRGFIRVSDEMRSTSHDNIFAGGDCASIEGENIPRSGVYAVRQGPVMAENIRRLIEGRGLRRYRPQHRFLSLMATGERRAVASRGPLFAAGAWVWRWKSHIDRRFMAKFSELPAMADKPVQPADEEMRCGGCGAKVGSQALQRALQKLGEDTGSGAALAIEDAVVFTPPADRQMVQTMDHFRAFIDDPYLVGRIGANHCLGDIYAMGATPDSALALANIPYGHPRIMEDTLYQLMRGAVSTLQEADARLLGGHSGEAMELAFGMTVNGHVAPGQALLKSGLVAGQALVLSKPLGTGTLLAANMRHAARGRWIDGALENMQQSNATAATIIRQFGAGACTDVTGFGLLGHLLEMLHASGTGAGLFLDAIPLLPGAEQCLQKQLFSTLHPDNASVRSYISNDVAQTHTARVDILFDPQTAGGLLCGIADERAKDCVAALKLAGYQAAVVGRVLDTDGEVRVELV